MLLWVQRSLNFYGFLGRLGLFGDFGFDQNFVGLVLVAPIIMGYPREACGSGWIVSAESGLARSCAELAEFAGF